MRRFFTRTVLAWLATSQLVTAQAELSVLSPTPASKGEQLFLDNCAECHQPSGQGLKGIYPSLVTSEVVRGSGVDVALQLIIGRGEMPSFAGAMPAEDMAALINFVRNAWGNSGELVTAGTVQALMR